MFEWITSGLLINVCKRWQKTCVRVCVCVCVCGGGGLFLWLKLSSTVSTRGEKRSCFYSFYFKLAIDNFCFALAHSGVNTSNTVSLLQDFFCKKKEALQQLKLEEALITTGITVETTLLKDKEPSRWRRQRRWRGRVINRGEIRVNRRTLTWWRTSWCCVKICYPVNTCSLRVINTTRRLFLPFLKMALRSGFLGQIGIATVVFCLRQ